MYLTLIYQQIPVKTQIINEKPDIVKRGNEKNMDFWQITGCIVPEGGDEVRMIF